MNKRDKNISNVVDLQVVDSRADIEVNKVLDGMRHFDEVIVIGVDHKKDDGSGPSLLVATSSGDPAKVLLRIRQAEHRLLNTTFCGIDYY